MSIGILLLHILQHALCESLANSKFVPLGKWKLNEFIKNSQVIAKFRIHTFNVGVTPLRNVTNINFPADNKGYTCI